MSDHPYADCPECGRRCRVQAGEGGDRFPPHDPPGQADPFAPPCTGSSWIVEDEDRCSGRWPR